MVRWMRSGQRRVGRRHVLRLFVTLFVVWNVAEVCYLSLLARDGAPRGPPSPAPRIFIASLHWNNAPLLRSHWNSAVLDLAREVGPENLFVSIVENGSWDDSAQALRELDAELRRLGVPTHVVVGGSTHRDIVTAGGAANATGWVETPDRGRQPRRIPYLAGLRNKSLEPLREAARRGVLFDKVLFLGDVVFSTDDIFRLLRTNDGDYAAACSLDFSHPPRFYDTFALRDFEGHEKVTATWPYLRSRVSRHAMKRSQPAPVRSCWNGMVSMPARVFIPALVAEAAPKGQPDDNNGLRFRGIDDTLAQDHLEASECCLIHADNPQSAARGVFLNPSVRVGYSKDAYEAVHPSDNWLAPFTILDGLWRNRLRRWATTPAFKEWRVRGLVQAWEKGGPEREEKGAFCIVNEMQILVENGWAHV